MSPGPPSPGSVPAAVPVSPPGPPNAGSFSLPSSISGDPSHPSSAGGLSSPAATGPGMSSKDSSPSSPAPGKTVPGQQVSPAAAAAGRAGGRKPPLDDLIVPSVADFVRRMGGTHAISRILIANNGIAAVKAIRDMRRFAYLTFGDAHVFQFVAMATPEDIKANAAYIHLADEFVQVPGGTNNHNYANVSLITEIAERCGVHAVWAGWGHASENPRLPELLAQTRSKVIWIGPPPHAMRALGDKIGSTLIAQSAGVPCIPWSGSGITTEYDRESGGIPEAAYQAACINTPEDAVAKAEEIGFPLMVKASEGGGGKGIRAAYSAAEVPDALRQVQGEVPGSPVFLMRLSQKCRHLEVQLLADVWGDAIAVHGRDCSVQRRHQKIMEEAPVTAAEPALFREMEQAAVRLAKEVGYIGAGTVEYLYIEEEKKYYFLELNPRLQVEHPVTERITDVNFPATQLQIAMGIPLYRIEGIRRLFGQDPHLDTAIDFEKTLPVPPTRHCIACRITAEDPDAKFQPSSGVIRELNFRSTPHVWGYFSVSSGSGIHEFSDSQFGHLFAVGNNREEARLNMILALSELSIRGDIRTTVEYLQKVLEFPDFRLNKISTTWLEEMMDGQKIQVDQPAPTLAVLLGAVFRGYQESTAKLKDYMSNLSRGQFPSSSLHAQLICSTVSLIYEDVKYVIDVTKSGPDSFDLSINGSSVSCDVHSLVDNGLLVLLDGKKYIVYGQEFPSGLRLTVDGKTCLFREEYDPTQLKSTVQGKLVRYLVPDGAHVEAGTPYAEVEVMKMYISLRTEEAGVLRHVMQEGRIIEQGSLLAEMTLDEPDRVRKAELFTGCFPPMKAPHHVGQGPHHRLRESLDKLTKLLDGYQLGAGVMTGLVHEMMNSLRDPSLPLAQFNEILATQHGRLPNSLYSELCRLALRYETVVKEHRFYWETPVSFPVMEIQHAIDRCILALQSTPSEQNSLIASLEACGLTELLTDFQRGNHTHAVCVLSALFEKYLSVESLFDGHSGRADQMISELRKQNRDNLDHVANIARAHHQLKQRNRLIKFLLQTMETQLRPMIPEFLPVLRRLSALKGQEYAGVVLRCRQLIMRLELPDDEQRRISVLTILKAAANSRNDQERLARLSPLIDQAQNIEDLLISLLHRQPTPAELGQHHRHPLPSLQGAGAADSGPETEALFSSQRGVGVASAAAAAAAGGGGGGVASPNRREFGPVDSRQAQYEALAAGVQAAAMEVYIRRVYQAYSVPQLVLQWRPDQLVGRFHFTLGSGRKRSDSVLRDSSSSNGGGGGGGNGLDGSEPPDTPAAHQNKLRPFPVVDPNTGSPAPGGIPPGLLSPYSVRLDILNREGQLVSSTTTPSAAAAAQEDFHHHHHHHQQQQQQQASSASKRSLLTMKRTDSLGNVVQLEVLEGRKRRSSPPMVSALSPATQFRPNNSNSAALDRLRLGVMGFFDSFEAAKQNFATLLSEFEGRPEFSEPGDVLYAGWRWRNAPLDDEIQLQYCGTLLRTHLQALRDYGIRRVTFTIVGEQDKQLSMFTFRHRLDWTEDPTVRHIEPCNASHMHLGRLAPFQINYVPTTNRAVHLFEAIPRALDDPAVRTQMESIARSCGIPGYDGRRFFVRSLMRRIDSASLYSPEFDYRTLDLDAHPETEFAFVEALNSLEMAVGDRVSQYRYNSIFLNVLVESVMNLRYIHTVIRLLAKRYSSKINRLNVTHVEFIIPLRKPPLERFRKQEQQQQQQEAVGGEEEDGQGQQQQPEVGGGAARPQQHHITTDDDAENYADSDDEPLTVVTGEEEDEGPAVYHFLCSNPTGFVLHIDVYKEAWDPDQLCTVYHRVDLEGNRLPACRTLLHLQQNPVPNSNSKPQDFTASSSRSASSSSASTTPEVELEGNCREGRGGLLDGLPLDTPYAVFFPLQRQRMAAQALGTMYAYDWLEVVQKALEIHWKRATLAARNAGSLQQLRGVSAGRREKTELLFRSRAGQVEYSSKGTGSDGRGTRQDGVFVHAQEYILDPKADRNHPRLIPVNRPPGQNDVGMICWLLTLFTPEYPRRDPELEGRYPGHGETCDCTECVGGRQVVLIVNDITFQHGTFGVQEDLLFCLASQMARQRRIPRLYFAANSGARIGLADEIRDVFRIAYTNDDPLAGLQGLYLTEADYAKYRDAVRAEKFVTPTGEIRWMLRDIVGAPDAEIGVENLRGSGLIAGETSLAYKEVFTLTFVTGRCVGIGAYLARLGQRCIQKHDRPLLLTGYDALNKLLGRPVYTSNVQLGGTEIMYNNGVSHKVVYTDLEGVLSCFDWLSYVPKARGEALPLSPVLTDPVDRRVEFVPEPDKPYDPRFLITGCLVESRAVRPEQEEQEEEKSEIPATSSSASSAAAEEEEGGDGLLMEEVWKSGLFDRGSWMEILSGWAQSVVCGRARLGGIPVGVITVETRAVEVALPADPANVESKEQVVQKAGQVWFPDSAFKTAQSIEDLMAEDLPLFVLANWRGFSGGMQDMYDEILKYGSYIVDRLREFDQPVFVYIPPFGTLRGGAWVVLDSSINQRCMEIYADSTCRAGILEPAGTVGVKFRRNRVLQTMHRLDPELQRLDKEIRALEEAVQDRRRELQQLETGGVSDLLSGDRPLSSVSSASSGSVGSLLSLSSSGAAAVGPPHSDGGSGSPVIRGSPETFVDPKLRELEAQLQQLQQSVSRRQQVLAPLYHQVATVFVDLHDTPGRMYAKQTIHGIVEWSQAREYFYWRLRRRLKEQSLLRDILSVGDLSEELLPPGQDQLQEARPSTMTPLNSFQQLDDAAWDACKNGDATFVQWLRARALLESWVAPSLQTSRRRVSMSLQEATGGVEHKQLARRDSLDFDSGLPIEQVQAQAILQDDKAFVEWVREHRAFILEQIAKVKRVSLASGLLQMCEDIPTGHQLHTAASEKDSAVSGVTLSGVLMELLQRMTPEQTAAVRQALSIT